MAKGVNIVEGFAQYDFKQFKDTPHIRYYNSYMYQGQWSGIPLFQTLKPHGEYRYISIYCLCYYLVSCGVVH